MNRAELVLEAQKIIRADSMLLSDGTKPFWLHDQNLTSRERGAFETFCRVEIQQSYIINPENDSHLDVVVADYYRLSNKIREFECSSMKVQAWRKRDELIYGTRLTFMWIMAHAIDIYDYDAHRNIAC